MLEQKLSSNIEAEIADLSRQIEAKRRLLETESGMVEDKQVVAAVVKVPAEDTSVPILRPVSGNQSNQDGSLSYLDSLDDQTKERVLEFVDKVFERGLGRTISEAKKLEALDLDAFHDTLTDRVYNELKKRGLVK